MPIGACWATDEVAASFRPGDHGTTFGGQPLAASAARATLAVMEAEDLPAVAAARGVYLTAALRRLPGVVDVRGAGLLVAAELTEGTAAAAVATAALDAGLVVNAVSPTALRLAPPLNVSEAEIDEAMARLATALAAVASTAPAAPPAAGRVG
jgi:acetylornithine/succinyldiaminopimelate/putrescine aminotransferase